MPSLPVGDLEEETLTLRCWVLLPHEQSRLPLRMRPRDGPQITVFI